MKKSEAWLIIAGLLLALPASAFTLYGSSGVKGWVANPLTIHANTQDCSSSHDAVEAAIDAAVKLWNSVPTTQLVLLHGEDSTKTAAVAIAATTPSDPVVICDANLGTDLGTGGTPLDVDLIPAATTDGASDNVTLDSGYTLLNAVAGKSANIANLGQSKLSIVIAHEMGHLLGLGHTSDINSLMYFDATQKTELTLSQDDMDGITYLYPRGEIGGAKVFGCNTVATPGSGPGAGPELAAMLVFAWLATQAFKRRWAS